MAPHHVLPNRSQPDSAPTHANTRLRKKLNKTKSETKPHLHIMQTRLITAWVCVCYTTMPAIMFSSLVRFFFFLVQKICLFCEIESRAAQMATAVSLKCGQVKAEASPCPCRVALLNRYTVHFKDWGWQNSLQDWGYFVHNVSDVWER